ncbi:hypothetical protein Forpe1208_v011011 [Fusarium oxysporum f. sp. rapae]|uniref:NmrA-like domain-containing protein n=1 Tax=Fusarium oxysporum f. sp. rapae TaxID=485398 RepID=A0A8J5NWC4_FUSOX|nr:hypothetical protein Forpe1208_v011011 [Fusarium oxysporum f. sp. rapae]
MVVVAVAGGTGGIGGAIVDTLRPIPRHKMIILTRKKVAWAIDIVHKKAGIPGTGNEAMTLKYTLTLPSSKFDVAYDPPEKLEKGEVTELPFNENAADLPQKVLEGLMSLWGLYVLEGKYDMTKEKALNNVFSHIQPLKVNDVLGLWQGQ